MLEQEEEVATAYPTHDELMGAVRTKKAVLKVNRLNHRQFVMAGVRYFCGWSSENKRGSDSVVGWITYDAVPVKRYSTK